ncbi:MAG: ankyrin repeat domain-containing protein [Synergistaceae bacterium]|nr:ankyrin repeat domain-containing protein [Synergistaceae bacterium]
MKAMKIIDLLKGEETLNFENTGLILMTGITESTLKDAITLAKSARESGVVSIGIPEGSTASGNEDMKKLADVADAVIFTRETTESISRRIAEELSSITERESDILGIPTITDIFRNAGTVYYGTGSGDDLKSAIRKATEMCGDIRGAKIAVYEITTPPGADSPEEIYPGKKTLEDICGHDVKISFSIHNSSDDGKFTIKIFALMYDAGYTDWKELFKNESSENIATMIENGLDECTRIRLGTEKSFFAACMRFGTPELVGKFISKGYNPKELEIDGVFPGDILHDCLRNDVKAGNTGMTDILLESGISLGEHCVESLYPSLENPKILQAFINYGWNVNSHDENGYTLMLYAASECSYKCVKLLVEAGADVNARDKNGYTPLMSIDFGYKSDTAHEILKYLLANGADINASADNGATPLTCAAKWIYSRPDIVRTFLNSGANVNAEATYPNNGKLSVLDIMFEANSRVVSEPEEKQMFLREVLPIMISAGAKFNPTAYLLPSYNEYQYFRRNWKDLLTEDYALANVRRLISEAVAEYDTETIRGIIERISPEKIVPDCGESPSEFLRKSERLAFRINDFPEAMINPSAQNTEIKRRLNKGAEILRIFHEAGITWPIVPPEGTELTYVINKHWRPRRDIYEINPLCLCHSPEALKKVIASGKFDTTDALKGIAEICEDYYQPVEMMNILLANGADIHALSDTWIGECLSHRGKRLALDNFRQATFIAEILRNHKIITVGNTQHYDGWDNGYLGGALSRHLLSHLWELAESGIDYGGDWVRFQMLLAACWGSVNDIEDAISNGGNVNDKTWLGYTPLMYASFFNAAETVKFLIKKGADINARNIHGNDALSLAVMSDYQERDSDVILTLAEFGADIHNGLMSRAVDAGNVEAVKVLLSLGAKLPEQNARP